MKLNSLFEAHILSFYFCLLAGTVSFVLMKDVSLMGDEWSYVKASRGLVDFLLGEISSSEFQHQFVGQGWFMPGMAVLMSPVTFFIPEGKYGVAAYRLWIIFINSVLLHFIYLELTKFLSSNKLRLILFTALCAPYCVLFLGALWADLLASLVMIILALKFARFDQIGSLKVAIGLGVLLGVVIYLRGTYIAALPLMLVIATINSPSVKSLGRNIKYCGISIVVSLAMLLPWSLWVSSYTGVSTLTVTSLQLSQIIAFGSNTHRANLIESGGGGNHFFAIHRTVTDRALHSAVSVGEQYDLELGRALELRESHETYQTSVRRNIRHYLSKPSGFLQLMTQKSCKGDGALCKFDRFTNSSQVAINQFVSWVFLSLGALFMLIPFRPQAGPILTVFLKGVGFLYLLHPFIASSHARYVVQVFPFVAVGLCFVLATKDKILSNVGFSFDSPVGLLVGMGQLLSIFSLAAYAWIILIR